MREKLMAEAVSAASVETLVTLGVLLPPYKCHEAASHALKLTCTMGLYLTPIEWHMYTYI